MKIFTFGNDGWNEYVYEDFDSFFDNVVQTETFFMFSDCTEEEIEEFFDDVASETAGLDDEDYYRFFTYKRDFMNKKDIYVYNDLVLTTFDKLLENTQSYLNYLEEIKLKF